MEKDQGELNIYQKLAKLRKRVEVVQKDKKGFGYKYVSDDELLAKLSSAMDALGISLIPSIVPMSFDVEPYTFKKTKLNPKTNEPYEETVSEVLSKCDMLFTWINNDNPEERVDVPWAAVGHQSDGSQGFGTALTYAYRYFLLKYFGVATPEDDPDNWRAKQQQAEKEEDQKIASSLIDKLDDKVKEYLAKNESGRDDVLKFVSKYEKSGNYKKITNSRLASAILSDFDKTFSQEEK